MVTNYMSKQMSVVAYYQWSAASEIMREMSRNAAYNRTRQHNFRVHWFLSEETDCSDLTRALLSRRYKIGEDWY